MAPSREELAAISAESFQRCYALVTEILGTLRDGHMSYTQLAVDIASEIVDGDRGIPTVLTLAATVAVMVIDSSVLAQESPHDAWARYVAENAARTLVENYLP